MCDDQFEMLRNEIEEEMGKRKKELYEGANPLITAEPLMAFMDSGFAPYEAVFARLRADGFKFRKRSTTPYHSFASAADRLRSFGISSIRQIEDALVIASDEKSLEVISLALSKIHEDKDKLIDQTAVIHLISAVVDREKSRIGTDK
jgi:hypothetical protein